MMLTPGATIGILGGGQLGRMLAIAAARLGFRTHIYSPEAECPAFEVATAQTIAAYEDGAALAAFAAEVSAVTLEFENVPVASVQQLEALLPVRPGARALGITQDRWDEKRFVAALGLETAPFVAVDKAADIVDGLAAFGTPAILKTRRFGYDGKGQVKLANPGEAEAAWERIGSQSAILEGFVPFIREVSVVATRTNESGFTAFDVTENEHRNHILARSLVPARLSDKAAATALAATRSIGDGLDYVGTFAVEFFVVGTGAGERVVVNEIAPRVHNSGHWTLDGAITCQFEQHIRAVVGWPLGDPARHCDIEMLNLVGKEFEDWPVLAGEPRTKLHLYGKREIRDGRKMGHATRLLPGR